MKTAICSTTITAPPGRRGLNNHVHGVTAQVINVPPRARVTSDVPAHPAPAIQP
jgi:hypothetical protein